ncbi:phage/plasmid primase, P4 family [Paenibacillus elgii]
MEAYSFEHIRTKLPNAQFIKLKGYSKSNTAGTERERYQEAKVPINKGWQKSNGHDTKALNLWTRQSGWVGMVIPEGYIVLDVDSKEEGRIVRGLLELFSVRHFAIETPGGYQFLFRDPGGVKRQNVKAFTRTGFVVDYRLQGRGQIVLPLGELTPGRVWINFGDDDADMMPDWFLPLKTVNKPEDRPFTLPIYEPGRNTTLFSHASRLVQMNIGQHDIEDVIMLLGRQLCSPPMEDKELHTIVRSASKYSPMPYEIKDNKVVPKFDSGDVGNAQRIVHYYGNDLKYCFPFKSWFVWDGSKWELDGRGEILKIAASITRKIEEEAAAEPNAGRQKSMYMQADKAKNKKQIDAMIQLAAPYLAVGTDELDADHWLLNVRNGILDLRTGKLLPHHRRHLITRRVEVDYLPDSRCPNWETFLSEIIKDKQGNTQNDVIRYLQKAFGYALTGDTSEHVLFFFSGNGRNGKGTMANTIYKLLGDYAEQANTDSFLAKQNAGGVNNDIAKLKGARYVIASESEKGSRLSEALVKQLTGGDPISARFLHKEFFTYIPTFKIFFSTNHRPKISGMDYGIWERMRIVDFNVRFTEEKRDKNLSAKLEAEFPGILNWMVQGCLMWQQEGLRAPKSMQESRDNYREEMDSVSDFIEDRLFVHPTATVTVKRLLDVYRDWTEENGEYQHKKSALYEQIREWMESKGYTFENARIGAKQDRGFRGIGVLTDYPERWQDQAKSVTQSSGGEVGEI